MKGKTMFTTEATYCPEDNKLRLYCGRVPREQYETLRAAGYRSTPKQDCDFVATWSVRAEDAALDMLDEGDTIGDEDQSPADRAADRAERFTGYLNKRRAEAMGHADTYEAGPSVHGYQSQDRADRAARRHDRQRTRAISQWDKAEYWQQRTAGVIANALYKTSASVRRGRILELERLRRKSWNSDRYNAHLDRRLEYERAMLESQGGTAADADIVPGGWFGSYQVIRVHKSPVTKLVVSVSVYAPYPYHRGDGPAPMTLQKLNIQRLGEAAYRAPTKADLEQLAKTVAEHKNKTQAKNAGKPKLINPTPEDAKRLQDHLFKLAEARASEQPYSQTPPRVEITEMTQAQYSARSKGSYARYQTEYLREDGTICLSESNYRNHPAPANVCKIRTGPSGSSSFLADRSIVVITDKPQKPLPQWAQAEAVQS